MPFDPSSLRFVAGLMSASSHGQRKDATDILALPELTMARCHTLLYLPLLNAYKQALVNSDFIMNSSSNGLSFLKEK